MTEQQSHPQEQRLATGALNPFAVASVVLGAIGLPAYCTLFLPVSAVVVGFVGLWQSARVRRDAWSIWLALAGIALGGLGIWMCWLMML